MMNKLPLCAALLAVPGLALATPGQLAHQGRLLGSDEVPIEDTHTMVFRLYDAADAGAVVWEETLEVEFSSGYYSVILGEDVDDNPIEIETLAQHPLFLELTVDEGDPLSPRHELLSVPYAMMADTCENVSGGVVDAAEVRVDGVTVIDGGGGWSGMTPVVDWTDLTGIPAGFADDVDDDTVLSESEVEGYITDGPIDLAEGSSMGGDPVATQSDLPDDAELLDILTDEPIDLATGTTVGGVAFDPGATVPTGGIIMWSGTEVPEGWALCDGESGTPDLRNRFVVGSGDTYAVGDQGGSASDLTVSYGSMGGSSCGGWSSPPCATIVTDVSGGGGTPPYFALAYIMKL